MLHRRTSLGIWAWAWGLDGDGVEGLVLGMEEEMRE